MIKKLKNWFNEKYPNKFEVRAVRQINNTEGYLTPQYSYARFGTSWRSFMVFIPECGEYTRVEYSKETVDDFLRRFDSKESVDKYHEIERSMYSRSKMKLVK